MEPPSAFNQLILNDQTLVIAADEFTTNLVSAPIYSEVTLVEDDPMGYQTILATVPWTLNLSLYSNSPGYYVADAQGNYHRMSPSPNPHYTPQGKQIENGQSIVFLQTPKETKAPAVDPAELIPTYGRLNYTSTR